MILSATAVLTAVWLGILTSISPCPLATNVAAMSFIGKDLSSPRRVLLTGVLYTLGRSLAYAVLAALLIASVFAIPDLSFWLSTYMNKFLGPVLIAVGIVLLDLVRLSFGTSCVSDKAGERLGRSGSWGAGLLGILFALSFCPVSAALFFGSLLPLAVKNGSNGAAAVGIWSGNRRPCFCLCVTDRPGRPVGEQGIQEACPVRKVGPACHGSRFRPRRSSLLPDLHLRGAAMKIQIAGPGCPNCQNTERNVANACAALDLAADISHVTNIADILDLGVMRTPAVVIDGDVVVSGRVPAVPELKTILEQRRC